MDTVKNPLAFPAHPNTSSENMAGMTLRDYFAAKVLQSIITNETLRDAIDRNSENGTVMNKSMATKAYALADAKLKERE